MPSHAYRKNRKYSDEDLDKIADKVFEYVEQTDFPLVIGAEIYCGNMWDGELKSLVARYDHDKLGTAYALLDNAQKHFLAVQGLKKNHDSSLTKFFLSACHGMTEKQHIVTESVESCIEADQDEVERAEAFEKSQKKVEV